MHRKNKCLFFVMAAVCLALAGCSPLDEKVHITDIKMAASLDANLAPVQVMDTFPAGTRKVSCWFKWKDSPVGTQLVAKWDYLTEKIHILDHDFAIPRRNGMGGILLTQPEGKTLPSGSYKLTLLNGKRAIKSISFEIE